MANGQNSNRATIQQLSDGSTDGAGIEKLLKLDETAAGDEFTGFSSSALSNASPIDASKKNVVVLSPVVTSGDNFTITTGEVGQTIWVVNTSSTDGALIQNGHNVLTVPAFNMEQFLVITTSLGTFWYATGQ